MGQNGDDGPVVRQVMGQLVGQVAVRPGHHDLVGIGEPRARGEDAPGITDRDPVTQEGAQACQRGGKVDGAEDQHPGPRCVACEENAHSLVKPLAVRTVAEDAVPSSREQSPGIVPDGMVRPLGSQSAPGAFRSHHQVAAQPARVRMLDDGGHADRTGSCNVRVNVFQEAEGLA